MLNAEFCRVLWSVVDFPLTNQFLKTKKKGGGEEGVILLCYCKSHSTFAVPLCSGVKMDSGKLSGKTGRRLGGNLRWTRIPSIIPGEL